MRKGVIFVNLITIFRYGSVVPVSARDPTKFQHQVHTYIYKFTCVIMFICNCIRDLGHC